MIFLALLAPAVVLFAAFVVLSYFSFLRRERTGRSPDALPQMSRPKRWFPSIRAACIQFTIGFVAVGGGALLINCFSGVAVGVGVFFCVTGYQIVLYSVGIESEFLANTPEQYLRRHRA